MLTSDVGCSQIEESCLHFGTECVDQGFLARTRRASDEERFCVIDHRMDGFRSKWKNANVPNCSLDVSISRRRIRIKWHLELLVFIEGRSWIFNKVLPNGFIHKTVLSNEVIHLSLRVVQNDVLIDELSEEGSEAPVRGQVLQYKIYLEII